MTIIGISPVPALSRTADTIELPRYLTNQGPVQMPRLAEQARPAASLSDYPMDRIGAIVDDSTLTAERKIALMRGLCARTLFDQGCSVAYVAARLGITEDEALDLSIDIIAYESGWLRGVGLRPDADQLAPIADNL